MRMVDGQVSDLYASDTDTWSATSSVQGSGTGARSGQSLPLLIPYSLGATRVVSRVVSLCHV
jgi:hypothetical protein